MKRFGLPFIAVLTLSLAQLAFTQSTPAPTPSYDEVEAHVARMEEWRAALEAEQAYREETILEASYEAIITNRYRVDKVRQEARDKVAASCNVSASHLGSGLSLLSEKSESTVIEDVIDGAARMVNATIITAEVEEEVNCGTETNDHYAKIRYQYRAQLRDGKYVNPSISDSEVKFIK